MKKILIIDDEPQILMMLEMRLKTCGYQIVTGASGSEAIKLVKEHNPDLIILDVMIPPPNGYQICLALKNNPAFKDIPVFLLTAKTLENEKSLGLEAGADEYVTKPYNAEHLIEKIKNYLEKGAGQG